MMDPSTSAQALRQEAIRRRLQGERRCDICQALGCSPSWFSKWWAEYRQHPQTDLHDRSRAPHTSPHQTPPQIEQAIVTIRKTFVAAQTAETRYGLIGQRAIRAELERLRVHPIPSEGTIQRLLARHGLTQRRGVASNTAYYPELIAWAPDAIHATDIMTRHLHGGTVVHNFHTFDHSTHAVHMSQHPDKTSATAAAH